MLSPRATYLVPMRDSLARGYGPPVVEDFFAVWQLMTSSCVSPRWEEADGVVRAETGLPVPPFNGVWQRADAVTPGAVLAAVDDTASRGLPWNVQLRPGYDSSLDAALAERGLAVTADIPFMVLTSQPTVSTELTFRTVVTYDDVGHHVRLLEEAFGMPPALTRGAFPMALLFLPGVTVWLGELDGEVVTTALSVDVGSGVGIFNVGTPEEHRGKGFGAAVTAHAVRAASAPTAFLQSSPLGESVYRRLGFEVVEHWRQWMPAEYLD